MGLREVGFLVRGRAVRTLTRALNRRRPAAGVRPLPLATVLAAADPTPLEIARAFEGHSNTEREALVKACQVLRFAAGNFYFNDKPTGAMVGLQPFGGARASGTNDKAGGRLNLVRWTSPRTIKETFLPATDFTYPFMQ